ncbi:MAG TPA: extracellular solute-binding protein [Bauldia sp.]|nr:extracellular solute-binding protein [Bauldia sp.]
MMRLVTIALGLLVSGAALAQDATKPLAPAGDWMTGNSILEAPRYPADFPYFKYVNPDAPKGGTVRLSGSSPTFDTLNPILPKGVPADGLGLVYESLFTPALDEYDIGGAYQQIADAVRFPADFSYVIYRINPNAKWHDGEPITADDVVWSFNKLVTLNDSQRNYYRHVVKAEKTAPDQVTFTFDEAGNRELPHIVGEMIVLPQHWWEGKDANGKQRDIGASTLEPPLGSGPYKVGEVIPGRSISYARVPDFWGAKLNTYIGSNNFDTVRYEYFRDLNVEFEGFKADQFDYWAENEAKRWNTAYDFPAIKAGKVKKETVDLDQVSGVLVGFIPNLRRPFFQDVRVRKALNLVFNFEDLNRTIFYGQYQRINSFFFGLPEMTAANALPTGRELELLNSVKDKVPPEVFTTLYTNPDNGDPAKVRANLQQALALFKEAGYELKGNQMVGKDGKPVSIEVMLNGPTIERVAVPYQQWLAKIGITLTVRTVDTSQFVERVRTRDFDMVYTGWGQSNSPGNEQLDFWGSEAADRQDSRNYAGIKDPAVDTLINAIIYNKGREDQIAAVRALDRVLMANQYAIPSYTYLPDRIAYWDRFGHPDPYPRFTVGFPTVWWWDKDKAAKVGGGG